MRQVIPFALAAAGFLLLPTLQGRIPLAFNLLITNLRRQSVHRRARCRHRCPTLVQVCCNLQFGSLSARPPALATPPQPAATHLSLIWRGSLWLPSTQCAPSPLKSTLRVIVWHQLF